MSDACLAHNPAQSRPAKALHRRSGADFDLGAPRDIAPEAWRDLQCEAEFAIAHASIEVVVIDDRRLLREIAGSGDLECVVAADRGVVPVEHGKGQVLDIHVDAEAHDEHQNDAAENGERRADRIPAQFERFPPRIGEHTA